VGAAGREVSAETFHVRLERPGGARWTVTRMAESREAASAAALANARLHTPGVRVVRVNRAPSRLSAHPRR
jgi:hypothetical protein